QAAVTVGATNEGMVAGDLVNTAARLQSVAPPGAVLVGETTQRAAAQAIAFEPVGDQILKGKTSPVPAWRAMRVVAERGGRDRSGLLETDDEATTRAKVTEALAQHVPDADERAWIEPALLTLLGLESGAGSEQLFAAWRTFFERLAAESPVVMIFEDLHFA